MQIYSSEIVRIGEQAKLFLDEGIVVFFGDNAPEELQDFIISIIGEGRASIYSHEINQWLGNLTELEFGAGYWIETSVPVSFYWETPQTNFTINKSN